MEVLKTSEELEKQILEDARKKARRILEATEKECADIRAEWEKKLHEDVKSMAAENARRIAGLEGEMASALPLDRMRVRLSFIEKILVQEINKCLEGLSEKETAEVFDSLIRRVAPVFAGKKVTVFVNGMGAAAVKKTLESGIPSIVVADVRPLSDAFGGASAPGAPRGIVLETTDGKIRFRGTFDELARWLLEEDRDSLVEALFGKDI